MKKGMQSGWLKFQNVMQIQFQIIFMTSGTLGILNLLLTGSTHWTRNGWLTVIWQRHSSSFNQNTSFENLNPNCFKFSLFIQFFLFCFCLQTLFADRLGTDNSALYLFYQNIVRAISSELE